MSAIVTMDLTPTSDAGTQVCINGIDVTSSLTGLTLLRAGVGELTTLRLEISPTETHAILRDPDIVRQMTEEECARFLRANHWKVHR